jgi:hypothetical protein
VLDIGPKISGFKLTEDNLLLRALKIHSMTYCRGEVKPSVPCHKIYGMLKNSTSMKEILFRQNSAAISHQVSSALLLDISAVNCKRAVVNESGMIRNQMGMHNRSEMVPVQESPCAHSMTITVTVFTPFLS